MTDLLPLRLNWGIFFLFIYSVNRQRMKLKPGPGRGREFRPVAHDPNQAWHRAWQEEVDKHWDNDIRHFYRHSEICASAIREGIP